MPSTGRAPAEPAVRWSVKTGQYLPWEPCKRLGNSRILPEEHLPFQGRCLASVLCVYSLHNQDNVAHRVLAHPSTHSQESLKLMTE